MIKAASFGGKLIVHSGTRMSVPLLCNGKGVVSVGHHCSIGYSLAPKVGDGRVLLQARDQQSEIDVGPETEFSNNVSVIALERVSIGAKCLIADSVLIVDSDFHDVTPSLRSDSAIRAVSDGRSSPTIVGDNVWLGSRSMVLRGARIGNGTVIGAGAVVVSSIPPNVVAGGVPARVIRRLD